MSDNPTFSIDVLRNIEAELSEEPLFRGVPLGPTLNDACIIELLNGRGDWSVKERWKNRLRRLKYYWRSQLAHQPLSLLPSRRVLVTWHGDTPRLNGLVFPVLEELGPEKSILLCAKTAMLSQVPAGFDAFSLEQMMRYDVSAWRADYRQCRSEWHRRLAALCHKHRLPSGAYDCLAFNMMVASQCVAGWLELLPVLRPSAIIVEFDRNSSWSCLVLAARRLGIPTCTMVHGVLSERAVGYTPVLADKILCWGEMQRRQLIAGGENRAEIIVAGCPRLTRELAATPAEAKAKLGLSIEKPVVLLGTNPVSKQECLAMAEVFCAAVEKLDQVSAIVRLHPSERLDSYESVIKRYPRVKFFQNSDSTLDESLAAADIVVVPNSGLGSDALVKRRLVVVLDMPNMPLGHGRDLIEQAGCPRATSSESLREIVPRLLSDSPERRACEKAREAFVEDFMAYFGKDAAKRIAKVVIESAMRISEYVLNKIDVIHP
jgi:hypothetical protein